MASKKKSRSRKRSPARSSRAGACTLKKCAALAARRSKRTSPALALPAASSLSREQLRPWLSKQEGARKFQLRPWLAKRAKAKKAKGASLEQLRPWLSRPKTKKSRAERLKPWLDQRASSDPNRRKKKRHLKSARRDASYRDHSSSYRAPSRARAEHRDYREAAPIKRARSAVYGWQKRHFGGKRPANPGSFSGQRRPVLFTPHHNQNRDRDWPKEKKRHSYAAAFGWQKRFRKNKPEYPGRRPEREFFRGARPVKSTVTHWPPKKKSGRDYKHRVYASKSAPYGARDRDWKGQPIRHARASALAWQRKFSKDRKRKRRHYPGKRPESPTFFGRRPVHSSAQRDHRAHY